VVLDRTSPAPLYSQLEELLRGSIESGRLRAGDRIPSELELAETHGISRMTARRAVDSLVMDGLLFRQPGKGTFVAEPKMAWPGATVFSFSTAMRALGLTVTTKVLNLKLVQASPRITDDLKLLPQQAVILLQRLRFVEDKPMAIHTSYITPHMFLRLLDEDLTSRPLNAVMEEIGGLRIVSSHDYVEATLARPDEAKLLRVRQGAPMLLIRGVVRAEGDLPVRSTKALFRGDHFRFFASADNPIEVKVLTGAEAAGAANEQWIGFGPSRAG
jgi:GntR family transcriptional regulator